MKKNFSPSDIQLLADFLKTDAEEAETILEKALCGGEISRDQAPEEWIRNRLQPNCFFIDEEGYSRMCVDALKILSRTAATDYGSSRQRDMGQLWADMTRGYLGELAFLLFLEKRRDIKAKLGHEIGDLKAFLPLDIHEVKLPGESPRPPKIKISVKTTKWNGIWLDIPGDQFEHSYIHVLVKIGGGRDHLFAFFKSLSVFRDKILKRGEAIGALSPSESSQLFDQLPSFKPIPAYICGFVSRNAKYQNRDYHGTPGRKNYTILSWNGPILPGDIEEIKKCEDVAGNVKFEGIGEFSHDKGYLFNAGSLLWKDADWEGILQATLICPLVASQWLG